MRKRSLLSERPSYHTIKMCLNIPAGIISSHNRMQSIRTVIIQTSYTFFGVGRCESGNELNFDENWRVKKL